MRILCGPVFHLGVRTHLKSLHLCTMGLLPDTQNCGLCMRRQCRERFPLHRLQRKLLVSDHGTCITHVLWCMCGSLTPVGWKNVPGMPGACATRHFAYLVISPLLKQCIFQASRVRKPDMLHVSWCDFEWSTPCLQRSLVPLRNTTEADQVITFLLNCQTCIAFPNFIQFLMQKAYLRGAMTAKRQTYDFKMPTFM